MNQYDREEEYLFRQYERGEIDSQQLTKELNDLRRDYAQAARDAAQDAYDAEMNRFCGGF